MEDLDRYDPYYFAWDGSKVDAFMDKEECGDWVRFEDYEQLQTEVQRLTEENEKLDVEFEALRQSRAELRLELEQRLKGQEGFIMISPETCKRYEQLEERLKAESWVSVVKLGGYEFKLSPNTWYKLKRFNDPDKIAVAFLTDQNGKIITAERINSVFKIEPISPPNSDKDTKKTT